MSSFALAWQFLTIIPLRKRTAEVTPQLLGQSMAFYPTVGLLLGFLLGLAHWGFSYAFPRILADGLVLILLVVLTGAFHLDGLADTLDGLATGKTPEERLRIMKDHHVGTFGVVGLILVLGLKFLALTSLPDHIFSKALLVSLILSRWSMVQLTYRAPYARPDGGLGLPFKENLKKKEMVIASLSSLALSSLILRFWGAMLWLAVGFLTLLFQAFFQKRIGGITGDILGAANEANEVFVLILVSGMLQIHWVI